jgi:hypothetical protein
MNQPLEKELNEHEVIILELIPPSNLEEDTKTKSIITLQPYDNLVEYTNSIISISSGIPYIVTQPPIG